MSLISIITTIYVVIISLFTISWIKTKEFTIKNNVLNDKLRISVVIAAKNEEDKIEILLKSLNNQSLDKNKYEIILINDHSQDKTLEMARNFIGKIKNLQIFSLPSNLKGKKQAVNYGISKSQGNLIVTTDADCQHHKEWLFTISAFYSEQKAKLIIAPVIMQHSNKFEQFQSLDFLSLMASGAAAAGLKQAIMCNAANMAFEKSVYYEFKDIHNNKYISGDDIFLLLNIKTKYKNDIKFLKSTKATVNTNAEKTFKQYINQRSRWASKSKAYKDKFIIFIAFLVLFINVSLIITLFLGLYSPEMLIFFVIQFFSKSAVDLLFLGIVSKFFKNKFTAKIFIITELSNIFLIPYFAIKGLFTSEKWK